MILAQLRDSSSTTKGPTTGSGATPDPLYLKSSGIYSSCRTSSQTTRCFPHAIVLMSRPHCLVTEAGGRLSTRRAWSAHLQAQAVRAGSARRGGRCRWRRGWGVEEGRHSRI